MLLLRLALPRLASGGNLTDSTLRNWVLRLVSVCHLRSAGPVQATVASGTVYLPETRGVWLKTRDLGCACGQFGTPSHLKICLEGGSLGKEKK